MIDTRLSMSAVLAGGLAATSAGLAGELGPWTGAGDELLLFEEIPVVVSAARQSQPLNLSAVPVSVVDAQDIHYSGLTTLAEVLQFVPGVDLLPIDRNNRALGVRGLHDRFSDRLLTLVDGRLADSPVFGGPELFRLPVLLEDIERVEVVRGPGGAAWGANAFTGVINVITKSPQDMPAGALVSTTVSHLGDAYVHGRWVEHGEDWSGRLSLGYEYRSSSMDALDRRLDFEPVGPGVEALVDLEGLRVADDNRTRRLDGVLEWRPTGRDKWSFGLGWSTLDRGNTEVLGHQPPDDDHLDTLRAHARWDRTIDAATSGYLQWWVQHQRTELAANLDVDARMLAMEGQLDRELQGGHELSLGANARWERMRHASDPADPQAADFPAEPFTDRWAGLFLIDRWQAHPRLTLEGQVRGDWYSVTGGDWSGRLSALTPVDGQDHHVLRLSAARAFRAPLTLIRETRVSRVPFDGEFLINLLPAPDDPDNEHTWALEAGYDGQLAPGLNVQLDLYHQRFEDLIGFDTVPDPEGLGRAFFVAANGEGADARGVELQVEVTRPDWSLTAWYAYNDFDADRPVQSLRAFLPARHKAGLTGRLRFGEGWVANLGYKFQSTTPGEPGTDNKAPSFHRLDLTLARGLGRVEVLAGVSDLFNRDHGSVFGISQLTGHETPGRSLFGRLQVRF